jgi:hypothetical protein
MCTKGELRTLFGPSACIYGELVGLCCLALLPVVSSPFCLPLRSQWFVSFVWELLCSICIGFLCAFLAFRMAYVT